MQSRWRRLGFVVGGIAGFVLLAVLATRQPELPDFAAAGPPQPVPDQTMAPVNSDDIQNILAGLEGQPVVLNIWGSWCAPCRAEMPLLQRVSESYSGQAVMLGVAVRDDPNAAAQFLDEFDITYPNMFDPDGDVLRALKVSVFPTTFVFDETGRITSRVNGGVSEQRIVGMIEDAARSGGAND